MLSYFPRDALDENSKLFGSVSEDFSSCVAAGFADIKNITFVELKTKHEIQRAPVAYCCQLLIPF